MRGVGEELARTWTPNRLVSPSGVVRAIFLFYSTTGNNFIECQHYDKWRKEAEREVVEKTKLKAETIEIDKQTKCTLVTTAKSLFIDDPMIWPLHSSFYYLGQIPTISKMVQNASSLTEIQKRRTIANISADWHIASIRLAGRIFGDFQRRMAALNQCPTHA